MRQSLVTTALIGALMSTAANAQTDTSSTPSDPPSTNELADIIVTAQRRAESLQDAAIPVDVVTGDTLANSGIASPLQLGQIVPALTVVPGGGAATQYFVRGVGNFTIVGYSDPAVAFNYDGVYIGRPSSTSGVMYDLERIEVLKGPQGTLYGRNATGGAINVIPARPILGKFAGHLNAGAGNYDAFNVDGALNLPVGDRVAFRVAASWNKHDGYLSDGANDDDTVGARVQFLVEATDALTLRLGADYAHVGGRGVGAGYNQLVDFNPATFSYVFTPTGFGPESGLLDPRQQAFRTTRFAFQPGGRNLGPVPNIIGNDNTYYGLNAELTLKTTAGTLTVIPAYRNSDTPFKTATFGGIALEGEKAKQFSLEARFDGNRIGIFEYLIGAHYFNEKVNGDRTIAQDALNVYEDYKTTTESIGIFSRLTAHLSDRFRFVGGIRYTHDDKAFDGISDVILEICPSTPFPGCPTAPVFPVTDTIPELAQQLRVLLGNPGFAFGPPNGPPAPLGATGAVAVYQRTAVNKKQETSRVTYRAALEFDVAPHSLLYASYETGFRSGGFSVAAGRETYRPEFITAWTIGSKNRLFDNRLQLNLEAFLWQYRDQQINHSGVDSNGAQAVFNENIGSTDNKGIEVQALFLAAPKTLISANVQYLDSSYDAFTYIAPGGGGTLPPPVTACPYIPDLSGNFIVDCSGRPGFNSPKWTVNLGVEQTVPIGNYQLVLGLNTQYRSKRFISFEYLAAQEAPSVWQTNASVDFAPDGSAWNIGAFVRNIENKRTPISTVYFPVGSLLTLTTGAPRTYGVRASLKF